MSCSRETLLFLAHVTNFGWSLWGLKLNLYYNKVASSQGALHENTHKFDLISGAPPRALEPHTHAIWSTSFRLVVT